MSAASYFMVLDGDNFFVSCERVFRPDLKGKPVVVLSANDGCFISRSKEAKQLGIAMGAPYFKIEDELRANQVSVFSSNFVLYRQLSARVQSYLDSIVGHLNIEQYSIDEWFVEGPLEELQRAANLAVSLLPQWIGIPASIGIASSRTLAKVAVDYAKHSDSKVEVLDGFTKQEEALKNLSVRDVWGVGYRNGPKLVAAGVSTAWDLAIISESKMYRVKINNVVFKRTVEKLRGSSCFSNNSNPNIQKNMSITRSFGRGVRSKDEIEACIVSFITKACQKLRSKGLAAGGITIYLRQAKKAASSTNYDSYWQLGRSKKRVCTRVFFEHPIDNELTMAKLAKAYLEQIYDSGELYDKAGIYLLDLRPQGAVNQVITDDLLSDDYRVVKRNQSLMEHIGRKHNLRVSIRLSSELLGSGQRRTRSQWLSPVELYNLERLPRVRQASNIDH